METSKILELRPGLHRAARAAYWAWRARRPESQGTFEEDCHVWLAVAHAVLDSEEQKSLNR